MRIRTCISPDVVAFIINHAASPAVLHCELSTWGGTPTGKEVKLANNNTHT